MPEEECRCTVVTSTAGYNTKVETSYCEEISTRRKSPAIVTGDAAKRVRGMTESKADSSCRYLVSAES